MPDAAGKTNDNSIFVIESFGYGSRRRVALSLALSRVYFFFFLHRNSSRSPIPAATPPTSRVFSRVPARVSYLYMDAPGALVYAAVPAPSSWTARVGRGEDRRRKKKRGRADREKQMVRADTSSAPCTRAIRRRVTIIRPRRDARRGFRPLARLRRRPAPRRLSSVLIVRYTPRPARPSVVRAYPINNPPYGERRTTAIIIIQKL